MLTKYENSVSDKCLLKAFKKLNIKFQKFSFLKRGSDERQYNSPGVDLPIASIFRSKYGDYKEYHTSLDSFENVVTLKGISGGFKVAKTAIKLIMNEEVPKIITFVSHNLVKELVLKNYIQGKYKDKLQRLS